MTNEQMKAGRYLRWHKARTRLAVITNHIVDGNKLVVATHTKATVYDRRHLGLFKATKSGLYVQNGKRWDCIDHAGMRFV